MKEEILRSRQNPAVQRVRRAMRSHADEFVLEGIKQIGDAIRAGASPLMLLVSEADRDQFTDLPERILVARGLIDYIADTRSSQGAVALFARPQISLPALLQRPGVVVVLDNIQDPGNVGTIVRLAAAFEAAGVVYLDNSADPYGPKAARAAAGAVVTTPVCHSSSADFLTEASARALPLFAAEGGASEFELPQGRCALILGNEGRGISSLFADHTRSIAVPISSNVESLNVAAAAAILLNGHFTRSR